MDIDTEFVKGFQRFLLSKINIQFGGQERYEGFSFYLQKKALPLLCEFIY